MSKKFVISDTHFGHYNIIKLCNRPFNDENDMNKILIENWNSVVSDDDEVYHLGDFSFYKDDVKNKKIFNSLRGKKFLIKGNHDKNSINLNWVKVYDYFELNYNEKRFVLFHYPIEEWNNSYRGAIHLYGHVHNKIMPVLTSNFGVQPIRHNVSVEMINYTPKDLATY